jgi:hypothetical protein
MVAASGTAPRIDLIGILATFQGDPRLDPRPVSEVSARSAFAALPSLGDIKRYRPVQFNTRAAFLGRATRVQTHRTGSGAASAARHG